MNRLLAYAPLAFTPFAAITQNSLQIRVLQEKSVPYVTRSGGTNTNCSDRGLLGIFLAPFLFADSLRILLRFAAFCRAKLLKLCRIRVGWATHNPLVGGSNPSGSTNSIKKFRRRHLRRMLKKYLIPPSAKFAVLPPK